MDKIRVDKWLHAVRLYKSRTLATEACDAGKIKIAGKSIKPSRNIEIGEIITIKKNSATFTFKVLKLIEKRVNASIAETCFEDITPIEEKQSSNLPSAFVNDFGIRNKGDGRPTKKDRREIDELKENREDWWQNWDKQDI